MARKQANAKNLQIKPAGDCEWCPDERYTGHSKGRGIIRIDDAHVCRDCAAGYAEWQREGSAMAATEGYGEDGPFPGFAGFAYNSN